MGYIQEGTLEVGDRYNAFTGPEGIVNNGAEYLTTYM